MVRLWNKGEVKNAKQDINEKKALVTLSLLMPSTIIIEYSHVVRPQINNYILTKISIRFEVLNVIL